MKFKYTPEMDAFLIKHTTMPRKELTELFNAEFDVNVNVNQIKAHCLRIGAKTGRTGRLEKGHATWNKGLKGYRSSPETMWKKGNVPHTAAPVGHEYITKDGYIECKFEGERQMKLKHKYLWEKANGPIPKGYALIFKNGIKTDCRLDNLMLLSRAELLAMNRKFKELQRPETRETVALLAKLYVQSQNIGEVA